MNAVSYSELRKRLKNHMDKVYRDHEPLIVTRKNSENVVLLSVDDFNALVETNYLLSSESNARRLLSSLAQARAGKAVRRDLRDESPDSA